MQTNRVKLSITPQKRCACINKLFLKHIHICIIPWQATSHALGNKTNLSLPARWTGKGSLDWKEFRGILIGKSFHKFQQDDLRKLDTFVGCVAGQLERIPDCSLVSETFSRFYPPFLFFLTYSHNLHKKTLILLTIRK